MALISIPSSAIRQQDDQKTLDQSGAEGFSAAWKDGYSTLHALAVKQNDTIVLDSLTYTVRTASLRRLPGDVGLLVLSLAPPGGTSGEGQSQAQRAKRELWQCHSVRNDRSILCFCGDGQYDANRAWIECWQKEADADVAAGDGYTKPDGTIAQLSSHLFHTATAHVIAKLKRGVDTVISFYPMLTRKRQFSDPPDAVMVNLGRIDTVSTSSNAEVVKAPKNLASIVSSHVWLKIQDDLDELSNGDYLQTESWIGAASWDEDLYGADGTRWTIPHAAGTSD